MPTKPIFVAFSVRLPESLYKKLVKEAAEEGRSLNNYVNFLIKDRIKLLKRPKSTQKGEKYQL